MIPLMRMVVTVGFLQLFGEVSIKFFRHNAVFEVAALPKADLLRVSTINFATLSPRSSKVKHTLIALASTDSLYANAVGPATKPFPLVGSAIDVIKLACN